MRLAFLMRDTEYRDVLLEMISEADRNIYLEVGIESFATFEQSKTMLITDYITEDFDEATLENIRDRTVFISSVQTDNSNDEAEYNIVFKYDGLNLILSEITRVYHKWTGEGSVDKGMSRLFSVCGESDNLSSSHCLSLARQIVFRHGGSVLILPLGYINDYGISSLKDASKFIRLMYYINTKRNYNIDSFIRKDNYGINYLLMPTGINPIAYLESKEMIELISTLSSLFETIIIDIGSSYSKINMMMLKSSDNAIIVRSQQRSFDPSTIIGTEAVEGCEYLTVNISKDKETELKIDAYIMKVYGINSEVPDVSKRDSY
ncbi:MAG TPA: hypothetical protein GX736_06645 [Mogibacterium sp.]|nr:hypothetical protein [Mogibacterium sp.]